MTVEAARAFLKTHPGYLKWGDLRLSEKLGLSVSLVRDLKATVKVEQALENESESVTTGGFEFISEKDNLFEQFLAERGIDPDDVVSVKHWQNMQGEPRWSVVTRNDEEGFSNSHMEEAIKEAISAFSPPLWIKQPQINGDKAAVIHLYDAHVDKIILSSEVYDNEADLTLEERFELLEDRFDEVVSGLQQHRLERIIFPVGNDFFNTNGPSNTTKNGTPQPVLAPHEEVFSRGVRFYMDCVAKLAQIADHVDVVVIRGNHDTDPVFYLGVALAVAYGNVDHVEVHASRHARKYFGYGVWGLGFGHGDYEKKNVDRMPLWFTEEAKDIWYYTQYHELFLGDIHHRESYKFRNSYDAVGMSVHFMRSANGTDRWHGGSGWIGIPKEISATVFHRNSGRKNHISVQW